MCIATGFIFFVEKRKRQHATQALRGARWVDALAVTTVTGMLVATLAMLVANRVLPADLARARRLGRGRVLGRLGAGAAARAAGAARRCSRRAWRRPGASNAGPSRCWRMARRAAELGHHRRPPAGRPSPRRYWPVAGFDLALLVSAAIAITGGARPAPPRIRRRARARTTVLEAARRRPAMSKAMLLCSALLASLAAWAGWRWPNYRIGSR